jgi:16S rRNA (cytidine1402-2'-O)-methyltransferase
MAGTLYVVATPIGNLEDLTFRALRVLKEVDVIAAEDTRRTAKLLAHYEIRKSVLSLHEHNEVRAAPGIVARLVAGEDVALVSDAGTPGISDPGAGLVRAARDAGIRTVPIPGPSAVTAALSVAGFAADEFVFLGFPPRSGEARQAWLATVAAEPRTVVLFEAPHRIRRTLSELHGLVQRPIMCLREATKLFEELVECSNKSEEIREEGEFVVILGPTSPTPAVAVDEAVLTGAMGHLTERLGVELDQAIERAAAALHAPAREIKRHWKRIRYNRPKDPAS